MAFAESVKDKCAEQEIRWEDRRSRMLKIWYYGGTEYMNDAPSYFDNVYEDEWIEDEFVK